MQNRIKDCILDADLGGILAHEAIGHHGSGFGPGRSVAAKFMDKQVASPLVSLVDFAHHALSKPAPCPSL